jgi:hypothetical protein
VTIVDVSGRTVRAYWHAFHDPAGLISSSVPTGRIA